MRPGCSSIIAFLVTAGVVVGALFLGSCSFEKLQQMRELERIPHTDIGAVLPGEVNLQGRIELADRYGLSRGLTSPDTGTRCVYYRYHVERRETDSDGNSRWVTVTNVRRHEPFLLSDNTGTLVVYPHSEVQYNVDRSHRRRRGDMRYTEYRLDPGDVVFCFGYAEAHDHPTRFNVGFTHEGRYTPILSEHGELGERVNMATTSLFACWGSVSLLAFAVFLVCLIFKVHRIIIYLGIVAVLLGLGLTYWGLTMLDDDLNSAHERMARHRGQAEQEWQTLLSQHGISWDGTWESLGSLSEERFASLTPHERERLSRVRIDLWRANERTNEVLARFPERWLAPLWGLEPFAEIALPEEEVSRAADLDEMFHPAKIWEELAWALGIAALLLSVILTRFGLRRIRHKRYTENVPTSPTTGVTWGPTEVIGTITGIEECEPLKGPVSNKDCVHYHYEVRERRGSGKNESWVKIEERTDKQTFLCTDSHGHLKIEPEGAEVMTRHHTTSRQGKYRYEETRLEIGDKLYALGYAKAPPPNFDELRMQKPDDRVMSDFPYLLANYSVEEVRFRLARRGFFMLNIALSAIVLVALLFFGASGSFAATDYLFAALIAPFYLFLLVGILMYNGIAFLHNRVGATRSNIEVALKKRYDLLPQLEATVKQYMQHEQDLIERITEARTSAHTPSIDEPALGGLAAVIEDYPELKADKNTGHMMQTLIQIENEVAMMRHGYNQAVERYNSRIEHIPEMFIAKLARYKPAEFFRAEYNVKAVPNLAINPPSDDQEPTTQ